MQYQAVLPILGFHDVTTLKLEPIDDTFFRLSNTENGGTPSFTLVRPGVLRDDYVFDLPESAARALELTDEKDALVLNLMILDTPLENSHINFLAPLIFNTANGKMGQVVLDSAHYAGYGLAEPLKNFLKKAEDAS